MQTALPRRRALLLASAAIPVASGCATTAPPPPDVAREQIRAAERAFAATMSRRDIAAFAALIAEDAVFVNGGKPLRGKSAIVEFWSKFFKDPEPPFAWEPVMAEVAGDGRLGYTEGPVTTAGKVFARFHTTWQRQADGRWLVAFDNGYAECKA